LKRVVEVFSLRRVVLPNLSVFILKILSNVSSTLKVMVREEIREEMRPYYLRSGTCETTIIVLINYCNSGTIFIAFSSAG
jgi:hypothetical protein